MSFIIGLSFYSFNARMVHHNSIPMPFGVGVSVVLSNSMEPEFSVGDLIVVVEEDDYVINDVVVYHSTTMAVAHRIVDIDGDKIITRGDANSANDEPIDKSCIKGKVMFSVPYVGYVVLFLKSTPGTLIVLGLAFFLFEYSFIREKKEQRKKIAEIRNEIETLKKEQDTQ
jgi:signal peptidase